MAMNKSNQNSAKPSADANPVNLLGKDSNSQVVRIDKDSDDNFQALFDSVLNPGDSKRPLQVPFRMRKLPNSFFNPPAPNLRSPSVSHSRTNSADSAYDTGSQSNVSHAVVISPVQSTQTPTITSVAQSQTPPGKLNICHSRAHSSPASLQQTYSLHSGNFGAEGVESNFASNIAFTPSTNAAAAAAAAIGVNPTNTKPVPAFHMKQRSYDVISPIQLQNELGALPPGWEQAKTNDGQIYYLNHSTKTTQWEDPRIQYKQQQQQQQQQRNIQQPLNDGELRQKECISLSGDGLGPLPEGWEQAFTDSGDMYFINHVNRTTSWNDPRISDFVNKSMKVPKCEMSWINVRHIEKDQELLKQKREQNPLTRHGSGLQMDPFLSGDNHARQESSDSGLSLSSNTFSVNADLLSQIDDSMDCINENSTINALNVLECPDNLVSSLQLEDNICNEMFNEVHGMLNPSNKPDTFDWYKIN